MMMIIIIIITIVIKWIKTLLATNKYTFKICISNNYLIASDISSGCLKILITEITGFYPLISQNKCM